MAENNVTALEPRKSAVGTLRDYLMKTKGSLAGVLPKHLDPDRLVKIAIGAASRNPVLLQCTPISILHGVMEAGQLGLEAGSPLGHAYLVPFKNKNTRKYEATLIIGYRGLIELARRSEQVSSCEARVVHERDSFEVEYGLEMKLVHRPCLDGESGAIKFVYSVIRLKDRDALPIVEVMTKAEVDAVRQRSRASATGPWVTDYEMMARKTVLRRNMHYAPMPGPMQEAVEREDARDRGERVDLPFEPPAIDVDFSDATNPVEVPVSESRAAALKQKIKGEQNGKKITVEGADGEQLQPESVECDRRHDGPPCADPDCYLMSGDPEPDRSTDA